MAKRVKKVEKKARKRKGKEKRARELVRPRKRKEKEKKAIELGSEVLLYPLITEKAVNMIEAENKLCFIVDKKATKSDIKRVVEQSYAIKVDGVKVLNDRKGRKKAVVSVNKKFKADEIATRLGVI